MNIVWLVFLLYRLCESDSDGMKFMSQLFCVFTNSASSLLLGSNHSAPRLLLGCSVEHSRARLGADCSIARRWLRADGDNLSGKIKKVILFGDILTYS